jgi:hypothetical protein
LGRNAREYAQQTFGAEKAAKALNPIYERLIEWPKHRREWGIDTSSTLLYQPVSLQDLIGLLEEVSGAELLAKSLGDTAPEFTMSLTSQNIQELFEAEHKIAASSILLSMGDGGILQYRDYYQNDGYLRFWLGLVLQHQGEDAEAISELITAINLGCNHWRVSWYLAQVAARVDDIPLAEKALHTVVQAAPDFAAAQEMLKHLKSGSEESTDLVHLRLRDINLIIFPDWSLSEDEDAELAISGVVMNLLMEEDLDIAGGPEISLIGKLSEMQWKALFPRLQARILLENENQQAMPSSYGATSLTARTSSYPEARAANFYVCELDSLSEIRFLR